MKVEGKPTVCYNFKSPTSAFCFY